MPTVQTSPSTIQPRYAVTSRSRLTLLSIAALLMAAIIGILWAERQGTMLPIKSQAWWRRATVMPHARQAVPLGPRPRAAPAVHSAAQVANAASSSHLPSKASVSRSIMGAQLKAKELRKNQPTVKQKAHAKSLPQADDVTVRHAHVVKTKYGDVSITDYLQQGQRAEMQQAKGPKVLILGDSMMIGAGPVLRQAIVSRLNGAALVVARLSSGLTRPEFFNWPRQLAARASDTRYDAIVTLLGTNDGQSMLAHGKQLAFGSPLWNAEYGHRLDVMMGMTCQVAKQGLWLGIPPVRPEGLQRHVEVINRLAKAAAARHACIRYLSLDGLFGTGASESTPSRKRGGRPSNLRAHDGVHFSAAGNALLSAFVVQFLKTRSMPLAANQH